MLKRFRQEKAVWQSYGAFLLRQGQSDAANALLQRALQSLSNKERTCKSYCSGSFTCCLIRIEVPPVE